MLASSYAHAVDCGAGIGRITKNLLSKLFAKTDLVDPIDSFNKAVMEGEFLRQEREAGKIGQVFTMGLQEFTPEKGKYSVIWNQWCLGHLKDVDLVEYFRRCREGLVRDGGVIVVKENLASGQDNFDGTDSSFTRTEKTFRQIFAKADLKIIHVAEQHGIQSVTITLTSRIARRSVYGQNVRLDITNGLCLYWPFDDWDFLSRKLYWLRL